MTDTRLASHIERVVVDAVQRRSRADDTSGIADEVARIVASQGSEEAARAVTRCIIDGLRGAAARLDRVRIAVTGTGWVGGGIGSVEDTMLSLLRGAEHEVLLTAYSITASSSRVLDEIERAVATGVRTRVVVDRFNEQEPRARDRLRVLSGQFPNTLMLYDFAGGTGRSHLHAKTLVADRRAAVVGSANLTFHGLMTAHELAAILEGPAAELIARRIDLLLQSSWVREVVK